MSVLFFYKMASIINWSYTKHNPPHIQLSSIEEVLKEKEEFIDPEEYERMRKSEFMLSFDVL